MKRRMITLCIVMTLGFIAYVLSSGAPSRVHAAVALTWFPSLTMLSAVLWSQRVNQNSRLLLVIAGLLVFGAASAYSTASVVNKAEMSAQLWLAHTLLVTVSFFFLQLLVWVGVRLFQRNRFQP